MPVVMEQVNKMSAEEKLRLMEYILKSISAVIGNQPAGKIDLREEYFGCQRPDYSKLIGYGERFHTPRSTAEWMKELREGEEE